MIKRLKWNLQAPLSLAFLSKVNSTKSGIRIQISIYYFEEYNIT